MSLGISRRPHARAVGLMALLSLAACATGTPRPVADGDPVEPPMVEMVAPLDPELRCRLARSALLVNAMPAVNAANWRPPRRQPEPPGFFEGLFYTPLGFIIVLPLIPVVAGVLAYHDLSDHPAEHHVAIRDIDLATSFLASLDDDVPKRELSVSTVCPANTSVAACQGHVAGAADLLIRVYLQTQYLGSSKQLPNGALAISMSTLISPIEDGTISASRYQMHWRWRAPQPSSTNAAATGPSAFRAAVDAGLGRLARTLEDDLWRRVQPVALPAAVAGQLPAQQIFSQPPGSIVPAELRPLWLTVLE